jgi:hypothetical protein
MGRPRKEELRERKKEEQTELVRVVKATRERQDAVKRAKALLAVAAGATLTVAGQEADLSWLNWFPASISAGSPSWRPPPGVAADRRLRASSGHVS